MIYTYNIKKNNNKKNPSNNTSKAIDDFIISNLKNTAPYIFGKKKEKTINIDITPKRTTRTINIDITRTPKKTAKPTFAEFLNAFNHLMNIHEEDTYDFLLSDGTPVKFYGDEVQIGLDLYSIDGLFNTLSDDRKKDIIDIYINIKK
uniref:Uncharacterized protein n=1 Tax=Dulem virus 42 TaxID=3145760 RepID=A0AAU8B7Y3_9CAUD